MTVTTIMEYDIVEFQLLQLRNFPPLNPVKERVESMCVLHVCRLQTFTVIYATANSNEIEEGMLYTVHTYICIMHIIFMYRLDNYMYIECVNIGTHVKCSTPLQNYLLSNSTS